MIQSLSLSYSILFNVQAHVLNVLDNIISPTDEKVRKIAVETKNNDFDLWNRLDAVLFQWM